MDFKRSKRLMAIWAACYWILAVTIYLVAGQQFHYTAVTSDALSATTTVGELVDGMTITQRLIAPAESLTGFDLMTATYGRSNTGTLHAVFTQQCRRSGRRKGYRYRNATGKQIFYHLTGQRGTGAGR